MKRVPSLGLLILALVLLLVLTGPALADEAKGRIKTLDLDKSTFVMADEPKDTYYVVTVIYRSPKSPEDFRYEVYRDIGIGQTRAAVLGTFMQESQRKTFESVMGLIKKEFKYEETEEQKKKLDENEKRGGSEQ